MRALIEARHFLINLIPLSPDGADQRRVGRIVLELFAQGYDLCVNTGNMDISDVVQLTLRYLELRGLR